MRRKPPRPDKNRRKLYILMEKKNLNMIARARITDCMAGKTERKKELLAKEIIDIIIEAQSEYEIFDAIKDFSKPKIHKLFFK